MKHNTVQCGLLIVSLCLPVAGIASGENLYITDPITGCRVWTDKAPSTSEAVSWDGQCVGGKANGEGTLSWFAEGKLLGRYQGGMALGKLHGQGVLYYAEKEGYNRYDGEFVLGKLVGSVKYYGADGDYFSGTAVDDGHLAEGTFITADGEEYKGELQNGLYHGKGVLLMPNGTIVKGTFAAGKAEGKGVVLMPDKSVYDVTFVQGQVDGKVQLTKTDGSTEKQLWKMGKQIKTAAEGGN